MAVHNDPRWPLPVDHPSALPEAIGRVAMSSAMLECTLRNVIDSLKFRYSEERLTHGKLLKDLIENADKAFKDRPFWDRQSAYEEWRPLRSELRRINNERNHVLHSIWIVDQGGKMTARREHNKATRRAQPFTLGRVRKLSTAITNVTVDVGTLQWNATAAESGDSEIPRRTGDAH